MTLRARHLARMRLAAGKRDIARRQYPRTERWVASDGRVYIRIVTGGWMYGITA